MWACLSLLLSVCLLHGGGAESEGGGRRCQPPPAWRIGEAEPMKDAAGRVTVVTLLEATWLSCVVQASRLEGLRQTLESQGLRDLNFIVVNHQRAEAQLAHARLQQRLSEKITLYRQSEHEPDVWRALGGEKHDFFVYDRCGRLARQVSRPYSFVGLGHAEAAIRDVYCGRLCGNCTHESAETPEECNARPDADGAAAERENADHGHGHHRHRRGHHHGRGHAHHGDQQGAHHGHNREHDHGGHQQGGHDWGHSQGHLDVAQQSYVDFGQIHHVAHARQEPQEALGAPVVQVQVPWALERARWKSKHSWEWSAGASAGAAPPASWCWHWRRLFGDAGSERPAAAWHCGEALPASWQWHGPTGGGADDVRETWQWRPHPADWQQPWAWAPGVASWGWEQL